LLGIGYLAVVQDDDPNQGALTLRMFGILLMEPAVHIQGSGVVELFFLVESHPGKVRRRQPMAALSAAGLVENLKGLGNQATRQLDMKNLAEVVQRLDFLATQLLGASQFESCRVIPRRPHQVLRPGAHGGVELPVVEIPGGARGGRFGPALCQFTHQKGQHKSQGKPAEVGPERNVSAGFVHEQSLNDLQQKPESHRGRQWNSGPTRLVVPGQRRKHPPGHLNVGIPETNQGVCQ